MQNPFRSCNTRPHHRERSQIIQNQLRSHRTITDPAVTHSHHAEPSQITQNQLSSHRIWVDFWITYKLKFFLANWEVVLFENFLKEFIVCMYLKICVWLDLFQFTCCIPLRTISFPACIHTGNPSQRAEWAILSTTMDIMIPRNDVLIVLSLPPD